MPSSACRSSSSSMIWAWVVTSSAVVASSAISSFGPAGERHRDHDPLPHAAGELVRVLVEPPVRRPGGGPAAAARSPASRAVGLADLAVRPDRLGDLRADPHRRVERPGRVLEHHRHVAAAVLAQLAVGQADQLGAAQPGRAGDLRRRRQQAHDRPEPTVLPEPDSPMIASVLPGLDRVAEPVDRAHFPPAGPRRRPADPRPRAARRSASSDPPALAQRVAEQVQRDDGDQQDDATGSARSAAAAVSTCLPVRDHVAPARLAAAGCRGRGSRARPPG